MLRIKTDINWINWIKCDRCFLQQMCAYKFCLHFLSILPILIVCDIKQTTCGS